MSNSRNRSRGFTITLNNYNDEEYNNILEVAQRHSEKYIFGKEVGKEGTPHIQGYIYFKQPKDFNRVVKLLNNKRIHIEGAKGNPKQNYNYCSKDGEYISHGFDEDHNNRSPWINHGEATILPECEDLGMNGEEVEEDCGSECKWEWKKLENGYEYAEMTHKC